MTRVYDVFDKFSIVDIIFGFLLGIYLAFFHDNPNLWIHAVQWVLIYSIVITLLPVVASIYAKHKYSESTAVSLAFGFVIGSFIVGNFIPDEGKLPL